MFNAPQAVQSQTGSRQYVYAVLVTGILLAGTASAQSGSTPGGDNGDLRIGAFAGFTDRQSADFTLGAQIEKPFNNRWSAGATLEHTPDGYRGRDSTLVMGLVNYRPAINRRLKLTTGAGVEFNDAVDDNVMVRAGVGYDLFYEDGMIFTPVFGVNFGEDDDSVTVGATLHFNF